MSIITITYNHERYINQCIQSIKDQSFTDWELIVVDDKSTDKTRELISMHEDRRIRIFEGLGTGPKGIPDNYNLALKIADSELVAILEGDDFWPSYKLEKQVQYHHRLPSTILTYGDYGVTNPNGNLIYTARPARSLKPEIRNNNPVGSMAFQMLLSGGTIYTFPCTVMIKRESLEAIGGFQKINEVPLTDFPTVFKLATIGPFGYVPEKLGFWRRHYGSVTYGYDAQVLQNIFTHCLGVYSHDTLLRSFEINDRLIKRRWAWSIAMKHVTRGRIGLLRRQWDIAEKEFRNALHMTDSFIIMILARIGIIASSLHFNLEGLARIMRGHDLRDFLGG
ncbi:glycosyltransferase [Neomoorella mulderi]|nr:glycosyltransferase [Moorella mulderi]